MMPAQSTLFCGYLFKRNPTGSWQRRYCIAFKNKLVYYKRRSRVEKGSPQGTVSFIDCTCSLPEAGDIFCHRREYCFLLRSSNREFYWSAESRSEFEAWCAVLRLCIQEVVASNLKIGPHSLKKVHFSKPTPCAKCDSMISGMGKKGFMCKVCLVCSHKKCMVKLGDYCLRAKPPAVPTLALSHLPLNSPRPPLISSARTRQYTTFTTVQLRQEITDLDKEEQKAIDSVNLKFELQMSEILDELASRYQLEVYEAEDKANQQKFELLAEIKRRESTPKQLIKKKPTYSSY